MNHWVKKEQRMTKDETLLVFTLVVSSVSVFLFGILLFMILISATRDFRERYTRPTPLHRLALLENWSSQTGYHRRFNTNRRWWGITAGSRPSGRSGRWNRQWCFLSPPVRGTNRWWWPASASPPACNTNRRCYEPSPTVRITNRRWSVFLSP